MDKIKVLQLGTKDWTTEYIMPEYLDWTFIDVEKGELPDNVKQEYAITFVDGIIDKKCISPLIKLIRVNTLYVASSCKNIYVPLETKAELTPCQFLYKSRRGKIIEKKEIQAFLDEEIRYFFFESYGEKYRHKDIAIAQNFRGNVTWNGNIDVVLEADFGEEFRQIAFWRSNIPIMPGQAIDFWLEYETSGCVEVKLSIVCFESGSIDKINHQWNFGTDALKDIVTIENTHEESTCFVSLFAKGNGFVKIIALHDRYSRRDKGYFLPGGERYVTSNREEVFALFDLGDMQPPLNIYFSGYKTKEGFEGYKLMRKIGKPFILISDARLEGGAFYVGSKEYEELIPQIINKYMKELGFSRDQVVMSGLSMGSYGAMYYGCDIKPRSIIVGKPLASLGNIATNEKSIRPGGFATSLDILKYNTGGMDQEAVLNLNDKFWNKLSQTQWQGTDFIISHMYEDDYDRDAYLRLVEYLNKPGIRIFGKGIHGRHNDNTNAIVKWFKSQFKDVVEEFEE